MVVDGLEPLVVRGDPNRYGGGRLPSRDPDRPHRVVVVAQVRDGTRDAASVGTDMARSFPALRVLIMCGLAGGAVGEWGGRPVRLGHVFSAPEVDGDYGHV